MAVSAADIKFHHCANRPAGTEETADSYGGSSVTDELDTAVVLHNLFDSISGQQAQDGYVDHRKFFVRNANAADVLSNALLWCSIALVQSANETWYFELFTVASDLANVLSDVSDLDNSDFDMSFNAAQTDTDALDLGSIATTTAVAIWIRRVIGAGCGSAPNEGTVVRVRGETA